MAKARGGKARAGRPWIKWLIFGPIAIVLLIQLYFFLMICWWTVFNPSSTSMMRTQMSALQEQPETRGDRLGRRQL